MLKINKLQIEVGRRKVQIELMQLCINRSREIILMIAIKRLLRNTSFFIARLKHVLPSEKYIKEINKELDNYIFELKRYISIQLNRLVGNRNVIIEDLFWFSHKDLKSGYILLYPNVYTKNPNYVLFLIEVKDTFDGKIYFPGDIYPFNQVVHTLSSIKGFTDKQLGLGFTYASSIDILNELSTLSSIIKSRNNERSIENTTE